MEDCVGRDAIDVEFDVDVKVDIETEIEVVDEEEFVAMVDKDEIAKAFDQRKR